jgi:trimeric autotransporter adhesin
MKRASVYVLVLMLALSVFDLRAFAAPEYHGQVTFGGLPVPGATVTATQGEKKLVAITNQQGSYSFTDIPDGAWKLQVEMFGFATQTQDITIASDTPSTAWELKLLSAEEITREVPVVSPQAQSAPAAAGANAPPAALPAAPTPNTPAASTAKSANNAPPPAAPPNSSDSDLTQLAATGLVVNGSVNNGAASAYAQMASFGNNRRGPASLYNGGLGITFNTSALNAASYSLLGIPTPKPSYNDATYFAYVGGPLGLPHHLINQSNFFVAYQHAENSTASTLTGLVPTTIERAGNLSQTLNSSGEPVQIYNPATNMLFPGSIIPVSAQAHALLNQYPMPNVMNTGNYNYETPVLSSSQVDSVQSRVAKSYKANQFNGTFNYQGQDGQSKNLFGYEDSTRTSGVLGSASWQHTFRPGGIGYFSTLFTYQFSRLATRVNPFFANRTNVSGDAGISGNDQTPTNWGPPDLSFLSVASLSEPEYARNANQTQAFSYQSLWYRGKHSLQFGGDVRRLQFDVVSQQDARGTFSFTGAGTQEMVSGAPVAGTGSDLADFLIGTPDAATIAFGNADKYLRGWSYDAYIDDDFRFKTGLTIHAGLRWEFADPLTEEKNRLVNLDVAPGFTAAKPVLASDPTGPITGQTYPTSLLRPDYRGIEPRVGLAWRPRANSPLVIRAGYGIYDNTSVYQVVATQLAQQPPLSKAFSVPNSPANPLTLADAFNTVPLSVPNTFGVDPNFRIGYAQIWNASVQQDLPASLTMTATYTGTKGTRLMQEYLPNTNPIGATDTCPACPAGFVYLSSNGNSTRQAGQIQLRRRLRNGLTATVQYTYAKAYDDASAFSGAGLGIGGIAGPGSTSGGSSSPTASIAQNWLDLRGEHARSTFDQRNLLAFTMQYTTGEGIRGAALMSGWRGSLYKGWTISTMLNVGSGLPLTPIYQTNVTGIGVPWTIRPDVTGASISAAPAGRFLNPAAFAAPASGDWGDAGRNSITGPTQFTLNFSFSRVFRLGSRVNAQWETDINNVLNTVTFPSYNTFVTSPLFGLPNTANPMRTLQSTFRVRF